MKACAPGARSCASPAASDDGGKSVSPSAVMAPLAPVWLQLVHLVMADAVWVALVLLAAAALACEPNVARPRAIEAVTARP